MEEVRFEIRKREIEEEIYISLCSVCGKDVESFHPPALDPAVRICNDCHKTRLKLSQAAVVERLMGSTAVFVELADYSTDEADFIILKRNDGTFVKLSSSGLTDDTSIDISETIFHDGKCQ